MKIAGCDVLLEGNTIWVHAKGHRFYASYPFNVECTPKHILQTLVWILMWGQGTNPQIDGVDAPEYAVTGETFEPFGDAAILSYSAGADSTAMLSLYPCTPVLIYRDYAPEYLTAQADIAKQVNALTVETDFELARKMILPKHGFNVSVGYLCALVPFLPALRASHVLMGTVVEAVGTIHNSQPPVEEKPRAVDRITEWLAQAGIYFSQPMIGLSEVWTTRITEASGLPHSSCHFTAEHKCLACYKCFRKEGLFGRQLQADVVESIKPHIRKKPYRSAVMAAQRAGYGWPVCDSLDMSFAERNCEHQMLRFTHPKVAAHVLAEYRKLGIQPMTEKDDAAIAAFSEAIKREDLIP